jgi:hypothetical protein
VTTAVDDCYWKHRSDPAQRYRCLDGRSMVCPRCCVEQCAIDTPEWFRRCAAAGHPTWPAVPRSTAVAPKLVCLESYWNARLFHATSVKGFLDALGTLLTPPLQVAHRFVESERGLAHYTRCPDGVLWKEEDTWNAPIYYLAFHGAPGRINSVLDGIGAETLCTAFRGYGNERYRNLVYFGACSVLRGDEGLAFARAFLAASGCRAVVGYTTDIDWMASLVTDLLFLHRFYRDADPWKNLRRIHASVQRDFRPAKAMGYTLVEAEGCPLPTEVSRSA